MIRILDTDFNLQAEIEPIYMEWTRRYYRGDSFTFKVPLNTYITSLNYVIFDNRVGVITKIVSYKDYLQVSGKEYGFSVNKRIVSPSTQTGAAETLQKYYVTANCITPTARKILNLSVESDQGRGTSTTLPARYQDLEELLVEIYQRTGLGWCIEYLSGMFIFTTIEGKDRTSTQNINPRAIFAEEYGNLEEVVVTDSINSYFNVVYMGGQGTGAGRTVEEVGTGTQNNRYELFADAKNLSTTTQIQDKGNEILNEYRETYQLAGTFRSTDSITYETDFFLGDIVTVKHDDYMLDLRLVEVKQIIDTKVTYEFTFGKEPNTINNALNKRLSLINSEVRI